jgi:cation diffusion facilitator family transporter
MKTITPHQALWLSVGAALATIALKWGAWQTTGSVAFLSDALESLINLAGASFALLMVHYARQPPDAGHPFGHGKAEYFSSAFEGALIAAAAGGIFLAAGERLLHPQPLQSLGLGTALSVAASLINLVVARILLSVGRQHRSLAAEADGRHLMTDVWTTGGVIVGVGLAGATGWNWLDPAAALFVAVNILREGWRLVTRSVSGLMDGAWPDEDIQRMRQTLASLEQAGVAFNNLRTRSAGAVRFAFVELHVPHDWSVERADGLALAAERAVSAAGIELTVRVKAGSGGPARPETR